LAAPPVARVPAGRAAALLLAALPLVGPPDAARAAGSLGAEVILLSTHLDDATYRHGHQYRRKLTDDGRVVITPGLELSWERPIAAAPFSIDAARLVVGGYWDSIDHFAGYVAALARWDVPLTPRTRVSLGLGPALIFRETWNTISWYRDRGIYRESDWFLPGYQHKIVPGGDVDVLFRIDERWSLVWSVVPAVPYVITQSVGLRWDVGGKADAS
jgi:hypothetical protein